MALKPYRFDKEYLLHPIFKEKIQSLHLDAFKNIIVSKIAPEHQLIKLPSEHLFLKEHKVFEHAVLPGVAYLDFVVNVSKFQLPISFERVRCLSPGLPKIDSLVINLVFTSTQFQFNAGAELVYVSGEISYCQYLIQAKLLLASIKKQLKNSALSHVYGETLYQFFKQLGISYGPYFQGIDDVHTTGIVGQSKLSVLPSGSLVGVLDAAFQTGMAIEMDSVKSGLMPLSIGRFYVFTIKYSAFRTSFVITDLQEQPLATIVDLGVMPSKLSNFKERE